MHQKKHLILALPQKWQFQAIISVAWLFVRVEQGLALASD